ncbi:MAG: hypothetical protein JWO80_1747, partial [Bryobacterales bacterium]|nr:hypothetical protein [Bryobacterales bacterium]
MHLRYKSGAASGGSMSTQNRWRVLLASAILPLVL